jgi:hypothetical protein
MEVVYLLHLGSKQFGYEKDHYLELNAPYYIPRIR